MLDNGIKAKIENESAEEIITELDFVRQKQQIENEFREKVASYYFGQRLDPSCSSLVAKHKREAEEKYGQLQIKKQASDERYRLDLEEIEENHQKNVIKINESMSKRGLVGSGIHKQALDMAETRKQRDAQRLKLKYGKTIFLATDWLLGPD